MTKIIDPRDEELELVAQIEQREYQPDLCTIYYPQIDEIHQMSTWITAKEGSFCTLASCR